MHSRAGSPRRRRNRFGLSPLAATVRVPVSISIGREPSTLLTTKSALAVEITDRNAAAGRQRPGVCAPQGLEPCSRRVRTVDFQTGDGPRTVRALGPGAGGTRPNRHQPSCLQSAIHHRRRIRLRIRGRWTTNRAHRRPRSQSLGNFRTAVPRCPGHGEAGGGRTTCGGSDRARMHDRFNGFRLRPVSWSSMATSATSMIRSNSHLRT